MNWMIKTTTAVLAAAALGAGASAAMAAPATHAAAASKKTAARPGKWSGQSLPNGSTQFTFTVSRDRITHFDAPEAGCFAISGYQVTTIAPPGSIAIKKGGTFSRTWYPVKGVKDVLSGRFTGTKSAKGTLQQTGACDTGDIKWIAQAGKKPPKLPPQPGPTSCKAKVPCKGLNGVTITVLSTDGTIVSNPAPPWGDYDTFLHNGGYEVTVQATNTTKAPITFQALYAGFQLTGGQGPTSPDDDSGDSVTGANGTSYSCDNSSQELDVGQTSKPMDLCFPVAPADQNILILKYGDNASWRFR